jgi:hypothetical protein
MAEEVAGSDALRADAMGNTFSVAGITAPRDCCFDWRVGYCSPENIKPLDVVVCLSNRH